MISFNLFKFFLWPLPVHSGFILLFVWPKLMAEKHNISPVNRLMTFEKRQILFFIWSASKNISTLKKALTDKSKSTSYSFCLTILRGFDTIGIILRASALADRVKDKGYASKFSQLSLKAIGNLWFDHEI